MEKPKVPQHHFTDGGNDREGGEPPTNAFATMDRWESPFTTTRWADQVQNKNGRVRFSLSQTGTSTHRDQKQRARHQPIGNSHYLALIHPVTAPNPLQNVPKDHERVQRLWPHGIIHEAGLQRIPPAVKPQGQEGRPVQVSYLSRPKGN